MGHLLSIGKANGFYFSRSKVVFLAAFLISALVAAAQENVQCNFDKKHELTKSERNTTATPSPPKDKLDVRLPKSLKPLSYVVKLQPFVNGNFSILGEVEIEIEVLQQTSNITLHIDDIITRNDTVKVVSKDDPLGQKIGVIDQKYDHERKFYIATLSRPLLKGSVYIFSISFEGYLNDKLVGFYRSSYTDDNGDTRWLAATQFQPTDARKAFPCFDEPALKATFEIYLAREENMTSVSNMPLADIFPVENQEGWVWDHFNTSVPMSTYLVAFVVSDFSHMSTSENGTLFRVWVRQSALEQAAYAFQIGPSILSHFEDYFHVAYPLPKQDMIAMPDFAAGAMENWGLILYRETTMLYEPGVTAPNYKYYVAAVVAHELAHQWFGNLVTPEWWDDLWLNEGFASFVEYIGLDHVEPSWKVMELFVVDDLQNVFNEDSLDSSHPISLPVGDPDEINQIFDSISYKKGASIIRMMNHYLTEASLRKGLASYLSAFKYKNAVQDDLWHHLTEAAHEDGTLPQELTVKEIMDTWTLQTGYPVITVQRSANGTVAHVTQERFLLTESKNTTEKEEIISESEIQHDSKWWVPLNYASKGNPAFDITSPKIWMKNTESEIIVNGLPSNRDWIIFNLQETGYYRVNYDENNWNLIIKQLNENHEVISTINRAQLIDDAMSLAQAGKLGYNFALRIYGYLVNEKEYVPWRSAFNNLSYLLKMFQYDGEYGALKNYIKDLVIPLYKLVGFDEKPGDDLLDHYIRNTAISWACRLEHQDCLDKTAALYRQWMNNPENKTIISPNIKFTVYCKGIELGDEEEWTFAWNKYLESNVASEKSLLLSALGCVKKTWMLSRYMKMAFDLDSGIRRQDSNYVFRSVAGNDVGHSLAWTYLRDQWDHIYAYHGKANKGVISSATDGSNTKQNLREIEQFSQEHDKELVAASRTVQKAIENAKNNIEWMEKNYHVIVDFLKGSGYSATLKNT